MNDVRFAPSLEWLIWAGLFIGLPAAIAVRMGASWAAILAAFAVLAALSCLVGFPVGDTWDQRWMWAAICWMVGCLPGIPLIVLMLRMAGLR